MKLIIFFDTIMIQINPVLYVILGILTTVAAQILLKTAGQCTVFKLNWFLYIFLSLLSYSLSFLSYYMALTYFDISKVSPIIMASCVALIALYGFVIGESFNLMKCLGIALAVVAIFLLSKA